MCFDIDVENQVYNFWMVWVIKEIDLTNKTII